MSKVLIKYDMFGISKRIKNIDKGYFILFNTNSNKFEVHHNNQVGGTYCLTCPFERLDSRLLDYVLLTSNKNSKNLLIEIENNNEKIVSKIENDRKDYVESNLKDIYDYASGSSKTLNYKNMLKTKWL